MGKTTRVAFFLEHLDAGGVERIAVNLLNHLDRRRFSPALVVNRRRGTLLAEVPDDVPVLDLGDRPIRMAVPRLIGSLRRCRADVVYAGTNAANIAVLAAAALMRGAPAVVAAEHTPPILHLSEAKWRPFRLAIMRLLYPRASRIAVPAAEIGEELRQVLRRPRLPVTVLLNPVIGGVSAARGDDGASPPWPPAAGPVFVAAGRLVPLKGFDLLLEALARLDGKLGESRLVILGEGPERARLEEMVRSLRLSERVQLPGFVPNLADFLRHADGFVLSSRREGFPNVLIEAMAAGTPIVATDCPVGPRLVLEHGAAGLLVPPDDAGALAGALRRLTEDPGLARRLCDRGRERASEFTIERAVPRFEALFEELAAA